MGSLVSFQKGSNTIAGHASFPDSIRRKDVGRCGHQNKISQVVSAGKLERNVTAQLAVVTFRFNPPNLDTAAVDALQGRMVEAMLADGYALATSTVLEGRPALRFCTINPRTTDEEIRETVRRMTAMARMLAG